MRRTHLGIQAALVLTMVAFVSWPQFRPVRAQSIWRYAPAAVLQAKELDAARYAGDSAARRSSLGLDAAARQNPLAPGNSVNYATPSAVSAAGGKVNALLGMARTSLNAPIPYARVVLRNIRTGQVLARTVANEDGQFSFLDLDANAYIVELLGADGAVIASSSMVSMARGAVQQTVVRSAAAATTVAAAFGNTLTSTAPQATTVASSNDITRTTPTLSTQESPR